MSKEKCKDFDFQIESRLFLRSFVDKSNNNKSVCIFFFSLFHLPIVFLKRATHTMMWMTVPQRTAASPYLVTMRSIKAVSKRMIYQRIHRRRSRCKCGCDALRSIWPSVRSDRLRPDRMKRIDASNRRRLKNSDCHSRIFSQTFCIIWSDSIAFCPASICCKCFCSF